MKILSDDARPWQHYPGVALDDLTPPGYTSHYQGIAWADLPAPAQRPGIPVRVRQRPVVDYAEARTRLFTNIGYGALYFLTGCVFFTRQC